MFMFLFPPEFRIYALVSWASIGSGNGLLPVQHQAINWSNAQLLSIGALGTNLVEISMEIQNISFMEMHLKKKRLENGGHCPGERS